MFLEFATKRDKNGNRYYLGLETETKTFSRERGKWYSKDDLTAEITRKERRKLIEELEESGFIEIECAIDWYKYPRK